MVKTYKIERQGEIYTFKAYDNGDEYIYNNLNENEVVDLEKDYLINGYMIVKTLEGALYVEN